MMASPVFAGEARPLVNPLARFTPTANQDAAGALNSSVGRLIFFAMGALASLSIIPIVIGGIYLLSSSGNPEMVQKGKASLTWGVIGLLLGVSSIAIYNFLLQLAIQ